MKLPKVLTVVILSILISVFKGTDFSYGYDNTNTSNTLFVPAGTCVEAILAQQINSKSAVVGQNITAILKQDFLYNSKLIASKGSVISGSVTYNKKADKKNKTARTNIRFTTITTPYGNTSPVNGVIKTSLISDGSKGGNIVIAPNSIITICFKQPITLSAQ